MSTITEQINERICGLPETAATEVLDFIGYLWLKLDRQRNNAPPSHAADDWLTPTKPWDVKAFLEHCAGSIPDFPEIEDWQA